MAERHESTGISYRIGRAKRGSRRGTWAAACLLLVTAVATASATAETQRERRERIDRMVYTVAMRFRELMHRPSVVEISADWCIMCPDLTRKLRSLARRHPGVAFYRIKESAFVDPLSSEKTQLTPLYRILRRYGILPDSRAVPLTLFIDHGRILDIFLGYAEELDPLIESAVAALDTSKATQDPAGEMKDLTYRMLLGPCESPPLDE